MRCEICLKSGMSGSNVSHSNRHTKTRFKANVHKQTLERNGEQGPSQNLQPMPSLSPQVPQSPQSLRRVEVILPLLLG